MSKKRNKTQLPITVSNLHDFLDRKDIIDEIMQEFLQPISSNNDNTTPETHLSAFYPTPSVNIPIKEPDIKFPVFSAITPRTNRKIKAIPYLDKGEWSQVHSFEEMAQTAPITRVYDDLKSQPSNPAFSLTIAIPDDTLPPTTATSTRKSRRQITSSSSAARLILSTSEKPRRSPSPGFLTSSLSPSRGSPHSPIQIHSFEVMENIHELRTLLSPSYDHGRTSPTFDRQSSQSPHSNLLSRKSSTRHKSRRNQRSHQNILEKLQSQREAAGIIYTKLDKHWKKVHRMIWYKWRVS